MSIRLDIEHIAGILEGRATLQPGVNAVRAHNWQGKSSFVEAIETALGVATTLTEGESAGSVTLSHDGAAYTVELDRNDGTVRRRGTPYLEAEYDRICTRLYACLDDANPIRRAVRNGENLEAHLTRPLEFEDIDAQIDALKAEQRTTERDLERAENAARTLSDARESVAELEAELESLRQQRAALPDDGQRAESGDRSGDRQELGQIRARRSRLTERIERLENTIDRSTAKLDSLRTRLEGLDVPEVDLDSELAAARTKRDRIERDAELLQGLYSANKRILEEGRVDLVADVERSVLADELDCWVCGSNAGIDDINS
ncbi:MAG: archaea-specific SMC-related protein, partial [Halobacteriota archaeon]